jgi:hypothetical protein
MRTTERARTCRRACFGIRGFDSTAATPDKWHDSVDSGLWTALE